DVARQPHLVVPLPADHRGPAERLPVHRPGPPRLRVLGQAAARRLLDAGARAAAAGVRQQARAVGADARGAGRGWRHRSVLGGAQQGARRSADRDEHDGLPAAGARGAAVDEAAALGAADALSAQAPDPGRALRAGGQRLRQAPVAHGRAPPRPARCARDGGLPRSVSDVGVAARAARERAADPALSTPPDLAPLAGDGGGARRVDRPDSAHLGDARPGVRALVPRGVRATPTQPRPDPQARRREPLPPGRLARTDRRRVPRLHAAGRLDQSLRTRARRREDDPMKKVLLTTPCAPYDLGWGEDQMDLLSSRLARGHDIAGLRSELPTWGLYLIAENIKNPCTVLEYPHWDEFLNELKNGYDVIGIQLKTLNLERTVKMVRAIKQYSPKSEIVIGGYGVGALDEKQPGDVNEYGPWLKKNADHLCREEGVSYMRKLLGDTPYDRPITQYQMPYARFHVPGMRRFDVNFP